MKILNITILIMFFGTFAFAGESVEKSVKIPTVLSKELKSNIMKVKVYGMACPLCQSKAETKFKELKEIKSVDVDMEKMLMTLKLHEGKILSEEVIKPIVVSLGLTFVEIVK